MIPLLFALRPVPARAQAGYEWLPNDGCAILMSLKRNDLADIMTAKKTQAEWETFFATAKLEKIQVKTLAAYLALNAPVAKDKLPNSIKQVTCASLPREGRSVLLEQCQNCHSVGPIVMMAKEPVTWLSLMDGPTHGELKLPEQYKQNIAHYLSAIAPVPEEVIPPELNQPMKGY
jgi:mono/diheme cytochrome c family protein